MGAPAFKQLTGRELSKRAAELSIRQNSAITLFSGSLEDEDFVRVQVHAIDYVIPPTGYGKHPRTGEYQLWDGTLTVKDLLGVVTDVEDKESIERNARNPKADRDKVIARAHEVAAKILEFRQERGVVALNGDASDEVLKHSATAQWVKWRRESAKKTLLSYHMKQQAVRNGNTPGLTVEPMDDHQNAAQEFIDRWNSGGFDKYKVELSGNPLRCLEKDCGYSAKAGKETAFKMHLKSAHGLTDDEVESSYFGSDDESGKKAKGNGKGKKKDEQE